MITSREPFVDDEPESNALAFTIASETLIRVFDWIAHGEMDQRSLRLDMAMLCLCPQLLPCKYPSAIWCAQKHQVSRQTAIRLYKDFTKTFAGKLRHKGRRLRDFSPLTDQLSKSQA